MPPNSRFPCRRPARLPDDGAPACRQGGRRLSVYVAPGFVGLSVGDLRHRSLRWGKGGIGPPDHPEGRPGLAAALSRYSLHVEACESDSTPLVSKAPDVPPLPAHSASLSPVNQEQSIRPSLLYPHAADTTTAGNLNGYSNFPIHSAGTR